MNTHNYTLNFSNKLKKIRKSLIGLTLLNVLTIITIFAFTVFSASLHAQSQDKSKNDDYNKKVQDAFDSKNYDEAIKLLNKALKGNSNRLDILKSLVMVYQKMGDYNSAFEAMEKAIEIAPDNMELSKEYVHFCLDNDDPQSAETVLRELLNSSDRETREWAQKLQNEIEHRLNPQIDRWLKALEKTPKDYSIHLELGKLYMQKNMPESAAEHFLEVWEENPEEEMVLLELANAYDLAEKTDLLHATLAAALASDNPFAKTQAKQMLGNYQLTANDFNAALNLVKENSTIRNNLLEIQSGSSSKTQPKPITPDEHGAWPLLLKSVNLLTSPDSFADIVVIDSRNSEHKNWLKSVEKGTYLILQGTSGAASDLGFLPGNDRVEVQSIKDSIQPDLPIVWRKPVVMPVFKVPANAKVFAEDRWTGAPLVAGFRHGKGAVLWVAYSPGKRAFERFPYLLQNLVELGLKPQLASRRLWAFLDTSYRVDIDPDYFAKLWRKMGISALHIAAWHYYEPDNDRDEYLENLITACHKQGIQIYAWLELPHVSSKFWDDHPEWREKTGLLQDAKLDWRYLMNLLNPDCFRAVSAGVLELLKRFDWDGVNLAELYFESLEGIKSPSRFTPMNDEVRKEFKSRSGFDPVELFDKSSSNYHKKNREGIRKFLDYRLVLARKLQLDWIKEIESYHRDIPDLSLVLTHVDDRFDTRMGDLIGADAAGLLKVLEEKDVTFLIEDPAPLWNMGPQRYPAIAKRYVPLTKRQDKLAIDINIVDRYSDDVFPTKKQTGAEFYQLMHYSAQSFARVTIYSESTVLKQDLELLPASLAVVNSLKRRDKSLNIDSPRGVGIHWNGNALVDGKLWPVIDGELLWLTPGNHTVSPINQIPHTRILDFNGDLLSAELFPGGIRFSYKCSSRAYARLDKKPVSIEIDGKPANISVLPVDGVFTLVLPRGEHQVVVK